MHKHRYLVTLFVLALIIRAAYLWSMRGSPLFEVLLGDSAAFDEWARRIAGGDWGGSEVFYQAPLYPYFLAIVYKLFGHHLLAVRIIQIFIGACSCVLVAIAGRRFFAPRMGLLGGLILAFYAPAVFHDGLIQKACLAMFFTALVLVLVGRLSAEPKAMTWVLLGVVLGCLTLSFENALVLFPVLALWTLLAFRGRKARSLDAGELAALGGLCGGPHEGPHDGPRSGLRRLVWVGFLVAGLAVVLGPVGLRNQRIGGRFLLTTSNAGVNFYIGNHAGAGGSYEPLRPMRADAKFERKDAMELAQADEGRRLSPGEVSRYWLRRSLAYIRSAPLDWGRLLVRKWFMVWNAGERADTESMEAYRAESPILRFLGVWLHFGTLCPLAAAGAWLTRSQWRRLGILYAIVLTLAGSITLFFVFARYRFPMVAVLVLFASAAVFEMGGRMRARRMGSLKTAWVVLALTAAAVNLRTFGQAHPQDITFVNVAGALLEKGRLDEADDYLQRALRLNPTLAEAYHGLGNVWMRRREFTKAEEQYRRALELSPDAPELYMALALALSDQGRLREAVEQVQRAVDLDGASAETRFRLASALERAGQTEEAGGQYMEALRLDPAHVQALNNLGVILAGQGRREEARKRFTEALRLDGRNADLYNNLGQVLAEEGQWAPAAANFQEALRMNPEHALAAENLREAQNRMRSERSSD